MGTISLIHPGIKKNCSVKCVHNHTRASCISNRNDNYAVKRNIYDDVAQCVFDGIFGTYPSLCFKGYGKVTNYKTAIEHCRKDVEPPTEATAETLTALTYAKMVFRRKAPFKGRHRDSDSSPLHCNYPNSLKPSSRGRFLCQHEGTSFICESEPHQNQTHHSHV